MNPDGGSRELYELTKDPEERNNVVERHPALAKRLADKLCKWKKTLPQ